MFLANELVGHLEELEQQGLIEASAERPIVWREREGDAR